MAATKEQQYLQLRQKLKEEIRRRMHAAAAASASSCSSESMKKTGKKGSNLSEKIQRIRESRDYSFLLSDDPVPMPVAATTTLPDNKKILPKLLPVKRTDEKIRTQVPGLKKNTIREPKITPKQHNAAVSKVIGGQLTRPGGGGVRQNSAYVLPVKKRGARADDEYEEDDDEDGYDEDTIKALSMIRRMCNTQRFLGRDDSDRKNMETGYKDMEKEEKRSAQLARKEDREQLRLIQEEERLERLKKKAKKT